MRRLKQLMLGLGVIAPRQEAFSPIALGLAVQKGFVYGLFALIAKKFHFVIDSIYCICRMRASLVGKPIGELFDRGV